VHTPLFVKTTMPSWLGWPPCEVQEPVHRALPLAVTIRFDSGAPWAVQLVEHWKGAVLTLPVPRMFSVVVTTGGVL